MLKGGNIGVFKLSFTEQISCGDVLKTSYTNFANLVSNLLNVLLQKSCSSKIFFPAN